jgi:hypothetical protein
VADGTEKLVGMAGVAGANDHARKHKLDPVFACARFARAHAGT